MRNLIASLVVVLFVSLSVNEVSAQVPGGNTRLGVSLNKPVWDAGIGVTVDYDKSWSPNRFMSLGLGGTLGAECVTRGYFSGASSTVYTSLNAIGRLHIPLKRAKFQPVVTFTFGPGVLLNAPGATNFDFNREASAFDYRTSLSIGHEGKDRGFGLYYAGFVDSMDALGFGIKYYKKF